MEFSKFYPGFFEVQEVKLSIDQNAAFEISVGRSTKSPMGSSKEVAQVVSKGGKSVLKEILFSCAGRKRFAQVFGEEVHTLQ